MMCRVPSILHSMNWPWYGLAVSSRTDLRCVQIIRHVKQVQYVEPQEDHIFFSHYYFRNCSVFVTGMFGYINVN